MREATEKSMLIVRTWITDAHAVDAVSTRATFLLLTSIETVAVTTKLSLPTANSVTGVIFTVLVETAFAFGTHSMPTTRGHALAQFTHFVCFTRLFIARVETLSAILVAEIASRTTGTSTGVRVTDLLPRPCVYAGQ